MELLEGNDKAGYTAAIPYLTIDATEEENQRLKEQITQLKGQHTEEWELLRQKVDEIRRKIGLF